MENNTKLTYEELEKKVKRLEYELDVVHITIAKYLRMNIQSLETLLGGSDAPIDLSELIHINEKTIDTTKPYSRNYEKVFYKVIGQIDS